MTESQIPQPVGIKLNRWAKLVNNLYTLEGILENMQKEEMTSKLEIEDFLKEGIPYAYNAIHQEGWDREKIGYPRTLETLGYLTEVWHLKWKQSENSDIFIESEDEFNGFAYMTDMLVLRAEWDVCS